MNMEELAAQVATELGSDWSVEDRSEYINKDRTTIHHSDGYGLFFNLVTWGCRKGRVEISGVRHYEREYLDNFIYEKPKLEISVNGKKEIKKIVKDIQKRLLPSYLEWWQKAMASRDVHKQVQNNTLALTQKLASIVNESARENSGQFSFYHCMKHTARYTSLTAKVSSYQDGSVDLEIRSLPPQLTEKILYLIKEETLVAA